MLESIFLAVTLIIPKAGVQLAGVPLTLNLVLFALLIVKNVQRTFVSIQISSWVGAFYYGFLMLGIISTLLAIGGRSTYHLAQNVIVLFSPLAIVATRGMDRDRAMKIVIVSLIIVNVVGLLQYAFGITRMSIQGLTYTWGQALESKPLGFGHSAFGETNKIISTYQSGNSYGVYLALCAPLALMFHSTSRLWRRLRVLALALSVMGLLFCGSRSIVLPCIVASFFLVIQRMGTWRGYVWKRNFLILMVFLVAAILYVMYSNSELIAGFVDRIFNQTLADPTAAGRTGQWAGMAYAFRHMTLFEQARFLLLGQGEPYNLLGEGLPEFVCRLGIVAAFLFYGMLLACAVHFLRAGKTRPLGIGMLCVLFAFCFDQAFYYPPTVMEYFIVAGIGCSLLGSSPAGHSRRGDTIG